MIFLLALLLVSSEGQASSVDNLPSQQAESLKATLERTIYEVSGLRAICKEDISNCITAYQKILSFDWGKVPRTDVKKIFAVSASASRRVEQNIFFSYLDEDAHLERVLGVPILKKTSSPEDLLTVSAENLQSEWPRCQELETFYDDLYQGDELQVTIIRGYFDIHGESFSDFLREQVFRSKKLPIFIKENNSEIRQQINLLVTDGFESTRVNNFEWRLTKSIFYKGKKKIIRINFVNSTVQCPGETLSGQGTVFRSDDEYVCNEQKAATLYAKESWLKALGRSHVLIYQGHSRVGNGPDFGPMGTKEGLVPFKNLNPKQWSQSGVVFMASCSSLKYFRKPIEQINKNGTKVFLLGTDGEASWENGAQETTRLIRMVSETKCLDEIEEIINLPKIALVPYKNLFLSSISKAGAVRDKPLPIYRVGMSSQKMPQCFRVNAKNQIEGNFVEQKFCAQGYVRRESREGKPACFAYDEAGILFGNAVKDSFCQLK